MSELATVNELAKMSGIYDIALVKDQVCRGASTGEMVLFLMTCHRTGLDPFARQIYYIPGKPPITSIDGYRLVAQRSGEYEGQTEPEFYNGNDWSTLWTDNCTAARVGVFRKGFRQAQYATARMAAYGGTTPVWKKMPDVMLSKCAEALALRKAFPQELSGLYTADEFSNQGVNIIEESKTAGDYQTMPMTRTAPPADPAEPHDAEFTELEAPLPAGKPDRPAPEQIHMNAMRSCDAAGKPLIAKSNKKPFRVFDLTRLETGQAISAFAWSCDWPEDILMAGREYMASVVAVDKPDGSVAYELHGMVQVDD